MNVTGFEYRKYEKIENCNRHWRFVSNEYYIDGNVVYVTLRWTKEKAIMLCDIEDWERLKDYTWGVGKSGGYATANVQDSGKHKVVKFHQVVMGQRKGCVIDHINRNPLDNRKENLRFVTPRVNQINKGLSDKNKSGYAGVSWRKDSNRWRAQITVNGKAIGLGCFESLDDAIKARKAAEDKYFKPLFEVTD